MVPLLAAQVENFANKFINRKNSRYFYEPQDYAWSFANIWYFPLKQKTEKQFRERSSDGHNGRNSFTHSALFS